MYLICGVGIKEVLKVAEPGKSLINLSISGSKSRVLNEILDKTVKEYKIPVFVSAGNNGGMDACYLSPSSNINVFTVGASDMDDNITYYSNVGSCVQIYAPGHRITSPWIGQEDVIKAMDGTRYDSQQFHAFTVFTCSMIACPTLTFPVLLLH